MATGTSPQPMALGLVGLGRMGAGIAGRLIADGHRVVVHDVDAAAVAALEAAGAPGSASISELVAALPAPRAVWVMVPAGGPTEQVIAALAEHLAPGDVVIDGGNTHHVDDVRRAGELRDRGIHLVDCGTSGGIWGQSRGYCLMVGGDADIVQRLVPILASLAPGQRAAPRTPGRTGDPDPGEAGFLHCGPTGAGHFAKMVHNGIEYGLMAAYAEGLAILAGAGIGLVAGESAASGAPLEHPEHYQYEFDVAAVAELWRRGSVIGSWLLDLTAAALHRSPDLSELTGRVPDSGEGRWAAIAAIEQGIPAPVLSSALHTRFDSQGSGVFAARVLSAMRREFGGHAEAPGGAGLAGPAGARPADAGP